MSIVCVYVCVRERERKKRRREGKRRLVLLISLCRMCCLAINIKQRDKEILLGLSSKNSCTVFAVSHWSLLRLQITRKKKMSSEIDGYGDMYI